ncbi:pantetheinase-like [Ptychodera flava]|uniref:pantetheinase-like n=1 Tax=Ptychodera flava TaxID=63121 RepID=UPI00396A3B15
MRNHFIGVLTVFLTAVLRRHDGALLRDNGYIAAVYEHVPVSDQDTHHVPSREKAVKWMNLNLDVYKVQAKLASSKGSQIIVFPEYGLFGFGHDRNTILPFLETIPFPHTKHVNPCDDPIRYNATKVLRRLSCIAKEYSLVVVAGMGAVTYCDRSEDVYCPSDGRYQYNAAVAFDVGGTLVGRYYKINLFGDEKNTFNPGGTDKTNFGVFHTAFGSFGLIICYDMLFSEPSLKLIYDESIKNIVFPAAWFDGLPTLTAVNIQQAWAMGHGVNLLASNVHMPNEGATGSGIYNGLNGAVKYHYDMATNNGQLLIGWVPTIKGDHRCCTNADRTSASKETINSPLKWTNEAEDTFYGILDNDLYTFVLLEEDHGSTSVCDGWLCCNASYTKYPANYSTEVYALGVFNGYHSAYSKFYLQVCVLLKCAGDSPSKCGSPVSTASTIFEKLSLSGNFDHGVYLFPMVLNNNVVLPPISRWNSIYPYDHVWIDGTVHDPLVSAAIYGRWFERDPK